METATNPSADLPLPRVLVVDDTEDHRDLQSRLLEGVGYEVTTAVHLRDARGKLAEWWPDIVLLDVCLPDGNGMDFCRELRRGLRGEELGVVLISSEQISTEMRAEGLEAGANDYIVRPMEKRLFLARIGTQVRWQQMRKCQRKAQEQLEQRVTERTRELAAANEELRREFAERRRAEASLEEMAGRFRLVAENARDLICLVDERGRFAYASPSFARTLGHAMEAVHAMVPWELVHPEDRGRAGNWRDCPSLEFRARRADGSWVWMEGTTYPIVWQGQGYVVGVAREITERRLANELMRELPQKILAAQESDRSRVSRELHDSVNQILSSVRFRVGMAEEEMARDSAKAREMLAKVKGLLEESIQEVRRISRNLRPAELDDLGLAPALRSMVEEFRLRTRMEVELSVDDRMKRLGAEAELQLYRIAQEALTNAEKHSGATRMTIRLGRGAGAHEVRLELADNGRGLPAGSGAVRGRGLGLLNMRERGVLSGGKCEVIPAPEGGVMVRVVVPVRLAEER